jgi:hypothetical protein
MADLQHALLPLLNFFEANNADLVSTLATKFNFDATEAMTFLNATGWHKKAKKTKDPNAPKKAPTAFFLFSKVFREQQKESLTSMKASEVAKLAGARWSEIKETDEAADFHTEAARLKLVRAELMASRSDAASPTQSSSSEDEDNASPATEDKPQKAKMTDEEKAAKKAAKLAEKKAAKLAEKKAAKLAEKEAAKSMIPSISLPFMGAIQGCCHGIRNNHGLYTQCTKAPTTANFCKTCATQAAKNSHGMPNCGTIETRANPDWRAPNGQQPVTYASFLQKEGNHNHVLADHSIADAEAAKFGWTIPTEQWQETPRRQGRPKVAKTAVVTDSSASEAESPIAAVDLVQKLVSDAKAAAARLPEAPAPVQVSVITAPTPIAEDNLAADDNLAAEGDLAAEAFEEEQPLAVSKFSYEGVNYLIDYATQELYCPITHEIVGTFKTNPLHNSETWIEFIDATSDSEVDEDDEGALLS